MSVLTLKVDEVMRTLSAEGSNPFVVHDKEVDIVRFAINSGFADIVLDGQVALRVMYQRPGETEVRAQTLTYYDTDGLRNYYDWQLLSADLAEKGTLTVALCILRTDGEVEEWHTTPCQVRVLDTIHTDDSDEADESITPTVAQRVAVLETMIQRVASGAPIVVASTSAMTDTNQIYVLSTNGKWYYHNGSSWVAGGEYGAVATDTTLSQPGVPADAKKTGDEISDLRSDLNENLMDFVEAVNPTNWFNNDGLVAGELNANGTVTTSTSRKYTDYFIPVTEGLKIWYNRGDNFAGAYIRHMTAYDADKNLLASKGSDSSSGKYTIQTGVAYVKITIDNPLLSVKPMITVGENAPTVYSEYFEPYGKLTKDFLTEESEEVVGALADKTINTTNFANRYACSLPLTAMRQTVGIPETFYTNTGRTPSKTTFTIFSCGNEYRELLTEDSILLPNDTALSSVNGFVWRMYDALYSEIASNWNNAYQNGMPRNIIAANLSSCTLLAIGDSTVDQDVMTQEMLDGFTERGATLTLLGTLGTGSNKNEGRAGWKASDYLTNKTYDGVVNPFYNPTSQTFDFSYYMTNQGYSAPDYVILQLGINDLGSTKDYAAVWSCIKTMIDSILDYNSGIKIILNLPTTPTSNQSKIQSKFIFEYQNRVVNYDQYAITHSLSEYGESKVRCSYCHLILNPDEDIRDNVHPTNAGYEKMANEVINQINCWQNNV